MNVNKFKSFLGKFLSIDYCPDCGEHLHAKYEYVDDYGDDAFCFKCNCGYQWHAFRRVGP